MTDQCTREGSDVFAPLRATAAVQALHDEWITRPADPPRERTYLVHRAALADRAVAWLAEAEDPATSEPDAEDTARRLLAHDRAHGTGRGAIPATDSRWDAEARGYVHQEHAATVIDEHHQEIRRG